MIGAALFGILAGSGLWLTLLFLLALSSLFRAAIDLLGHLIFLYRHAHPLTPAILARRARRL